MANEMQRAFEEKAFGKPTFIPRFFEHARINSVKTESYGIKIYDTFTYIEIRTLGRKDTTTRKARDDDKLLFHHAYDKFCEVNDYNKIPMEALAGFSEANRFILRDLKINSVELLADYSGKLPLATLKLMKHSAIKLIAFMSVYEPPTYHDDVMEVPRETIQAQRQVLPDRNSLSPTNGQEGNNGSGVPQFGVNLDQNGQVTNIHGQEVGQEDFIQEEVQQEKVQKVINFY